APRHQPPNGRTAGSASASGGPRGGACVASACPQQRFESLEWLRGALTHIRQDDDPLAGRGVGPGPGAESRIRSRVPDPGRWAGAAVDDAEAVADLLDRTQ